MSAAGEAPRLVSARMAGALVLLSAFSLLAVMALSAYAPELRSPDNPQANAFSKSAVGYAGLVQLLEDCGTPVRIGREPRLQAKGIHASLTILAPVIGNSPKQLRDVGAPGVRLIILPKWIAMPDPLRSNWVMKVATLNAALVASNLVDPLAGKAKLVREKDETAPTLQNPLPSFQPDLPREIAKIDSLQSISGPGLTPIVVDAHKKMIVAQIKGTQSYILADPDLMNTHGLHDLATVRAAVALIQQMRVGDGPVVFDVTLNGFGSAPDFFGLAFRPPLLGATLCALLTALLIGLHAMSRFGTPKAPEPAFALGKRALAGNTADLIRMMGREPRMTTRYADVTRNLVLKALGVRRELGPEQVRELLAGLERKSPGGEHFAVLAAESAQTNTRAHMLTVAQRLSRWRRGITRAR